MDFCFYWFTFIFALPRCESVRPNMPEIINLLKGFQCVSLCLRDRTSSASASDQSVWACLRLTFNILTSYFKNGKLRKHVSLAGSCPCPPSPVPRHRATWPFSLLSLRLPPAHTLLSKCQRNLLTHVPEHFAGHFAGNSTTRAKLWTWAANASAWTAAAAF